MAPTLAADTPSGQYFKAVRYIVRKVKEETTTKGDEVVGPRSKRVRQIYLDQFADGERIDEEPYGTEQKQIALDAIIRMTKEHVLRAVKHDGHGTFTIHPDCKLVDDMDHTPIGSIKPPEGIEDPKMSALQAGDTIEVSVPSNANAEASELTIPLLLAVDEAGPPESLSDTLGKKRRRTDEIADSDVSSRYASISPRRRSTAATEAGRTIRRLFTPEENRRFSAPSRFGPASPAEANTPKRRRCDEGGKPALIDFPAPKPIQCFSLPTLPGSPSSSNGEPNLRQARAAINRSMEDIENDSAARRLRTTLVEQRVAAYETSSDERFKELIESLAQVDDKSMSSRKELEELVVDQKQESNDQAQRIEDNLVEIKMKARDQDACVEDLDGRLAVSQSRNRQDLNEIEQRLTKSDGNYYEVLGRLTTVDSNFKKEAEELADRVDGIEERNQQLVDGVLADLISQISDSTAKHKEEIDGVFTQVTTQVSNSDARHQEQLQDMRRHVDASENASKDQIDTIREDLATSKQFTKETFIGIMNRLVTLEHAKQSQCESTNDVASQLQVHADELQRQRDIEEALRESFFAQMDAHAKQTAERLQNLEKETSERIEAVETAYGKSIKKLEKANKEQERTIRGYDGVFKSMFDEMKQLKEYVDSVAESVPSVEWGCVSEPQSRPTTCARRL